MAYTRHGHHISGSIKLQEDPGPPKARCGGTSFCSECRFDAAEWAAKNLPKTENLGGLFGDVIPISKLSVLNDRIAVEDDLKPIPIDANSPILRYFDWAHLPEKLQEVSRQFSELAWRVEDHIPQGPEKDVALRKLLEAKDAAVRASLG